MKNPSAHERLIVALDMQSIEHALEIWGKISNKVTWTKIGYDLLADEKAYELVAQIKESDGKILADWKSRQPHVFEKDFRILEHLEVDAIPVRFGQKELGLQKPIKVTLI